MRFTLHDDPEWMTECNCSLCRRIGAQWVHSEAQHLTIDAAQDATLRYVQGDATLELHTCRTCGCTTHWLSLGTEPSRRVAINTRLAEPEAVSGLPVRHFDGADSWRFLD
ncbi:GFA family protein [Aestuariibius sp. 2305UL40-4]|uniref:GFA family protein n=1 Tax=Aestuariibius violaceus TaxID=3234132 RepID=UPI00345EC091